jgi:Holliday junction resolvase-like predicted endonuclease
MSNYDIGHEAEKRGAHYLQERGYAIIELNWRVPAAEIDIVASKDGCMYFVEVKYRQTSRQGEGFDYITPAKLKHMQRAAKLWLSQHPDWTGEVCLAALSISGDGTIELRELF